jgi:hypothetical protein
MNKVENKVDRELFLEKFEMLSLKLEQLTDEMSKLKWKFDKSNKINRTFGLKALRNSTSLDFAQDVFGIGSPTKRYLLSMRSITEEWKGRKNDILLTIRQQEKETHMDLKALGIRIPFNDIKTIRTLTKEIITLLYIACELKGIEINEVLRSILNDINKDSQKIIKEIKNKMLL